MSQLKDLELFILFIAFCSSICTDSIETLSRNCSDTPIPVESLPVVTVYDAKDDEPNRNTNGTVLLGRPLDERQVIGWLGLECVHSKPIRWAFDLNFEESGIGDSYSATVREVEDFYDSSSYSFKAEVEAKIFRKELNFVLACVAFDDVCDRRIVEAVYNQTEKLYLLHLLSASDENQPLVTELENAIKGSQQDSYVASNDSSCDVIFSLKDFGNYYLAGFKPKGTNFIDPRGVSDRQTLENAHLYQKALGPSCVNDLCDDEFCHRDDKTESGKFYLPIVFFMTNNLNLSSVVRVYHTLSQKHDARNNSTLYDQGRLKFSWEETDKRDMMRMDFNSSIEDNPYAFYIGEEIGVECHLAPFYFSLGTLIGYQMENSDNITFQVSDEDPSEESDDRIARSKINIPVENGEKLNVTISCYSPVWDNPTEWGNISQTILLLPSSINITGQRLEEHTYSLNSTFNASCSATGIPLPTIKINHPENSKSVEIIEKVVNNTVYANIIVANLDNTHAGLYNCIATNPAGVKYYSFEVRIRKPVSREKSTTLTIILSSVFGSASAIFLIVVGILLVRFRMEKEEFRRLTEEAMRDFYEGEDASHIPKQEAKETLHYANDSVKTLPYDRKYEIPHRNWNLHNTILGSGAYGMVRKGEVEIGNRRSIIAVKTVKSVEDIDDFRATLLELKIMAHIGSHRHIVQLIAASTEEIMKRNVFIGVEYCANGSLLSYLQKRKKLFTNLVHDGLINLPENEQPEPEEDLYKNLVVSSDISTIDLFKWALQIANGMEFLESRKVLHADLAARNILLTEELVIKISDFGLSRDLFTNSEYTKKTHVALPWKWMAIESLRFLKFSSKSDVWGYGVTLYEVFTLGEEPYTGMTWNEEFINSLENGNHLTCPPLCTKNVYNQVMLKCWAKEPEDRLEFSAALSFFENAVRLLTSTPRNTDECRDFC